MGFVRKRKFYVIVDMLFFDQRMETIRKIVSASGLILFTTAHGIKRIYDRICSCDIKCRLSVIEDACYKIYKSKTDITKITKITNSEVRHIKHNIYSNIAFSTDICRGIFDAGTVIYWALQILHFTGFKQIFIVGLDMNNFDKPRFYETEEEKLPSFLHDKVQDIIIPAFTLVNSVCNEKGIMIFNLSKHSAITSDIFRKISQIQIQKPETAQAM